MGGFILVRSGLRLEGLAIPPPSVQTAVVEVA
jgi:hypothetical protein